MASVTVHDLSDACVRTIDERAAAAGRTREDIVREIIEESAGRTRDWDHFRKEAARVRALFGDRRLPSSVQDLDEARRERDGAP